MFNAYQLLASTFSYEYNTCNNFKSVEDILNRSELFIVTLWQKYNVMVLGDLIVGLPKNKQSIFG